MIEIQGKMVYESLEEVIDPRHTALMIIDMQNGLASLEGYTARHSKFSIAHQREILPRVQKMLKAARGAGHLHRPRAGGVRQERRLKLAGVAVHELPTARPGGLLGALDGQRQAHQPGGSHRRHLGGGDYPRTEPLPNEIVVKKHRNTAFVNTRMDQILKSNRIDSLVVTGTSTAGCVLATCWTRCGTTTTRW